MSTNLGAATDARKARLAQLRTLKRKQPTDETATPESDRHNSPSTPDVASLHLSGRNYDPEARGPRLGFETAPNENFDGPTLEEKAAEIEAGVRAEAEKEEVNKGVDLFKLQPKKPNWDLKRDLDKRLESLNVKTDNAIARLVRERIEGVKAKSKVTGADEEAVGLDGTELVEGLRVREQEAEEEERMERAELDV